MENTANNKNDGAFKAISMAIVPFALKWFVTLPQLMYWGFLSFGLVSLLLLVLCRKKGEKVTKYISISASFSIAVFLCILFYPTKQISNPQDICFELDHSFRTSVEQKANSGDIRSMERIGRYYISSFWKDFARVPNNVKRDDEVFDFRDFIKGEKYLNMAAERNSYEAYYLLGEMKMLGLGCIPSRRRAIEEFTHSLTINKSNSAVFKAIQLYAVSEAEMPQEYHLYREWLENQCTE